MSSELELLREENENLRRRLATAKAWMQREFQQATLKIAASKAIKKTGLNREVFAQENMDTIISKRIGDYFGEILLMNAPRQTLEHLIHSEINFYNLGKNPSIDGFTVISSYHKILDSFIEHFVTTGFRKYCIKNGYNILRVNDPVEKTLHLVVTKKYIIGLGRLYGLIKSIRSWEKLYSYGQAFVQYLDKHQDLRDLILDKPFFPLFSRVINTDVFWGKRHEWSINYEETKEVRTIMTGDFLDKNSIFYLLLASQAVTY